MVIFVRQLKQLSPTRTAKPTERRGQNRSSATPCSACGNEVQVMLRTPYVLYVRCGHCSAMWTVAKPGHEHLVDVPHDALTGAYQTVTAAKWEADAGAAALLGLRELVEALDRRVPNMGRAGELGIEHDTAALRAKTVERIAELELRS